MQLKKVNFFLIFWAYLMLFFNPSSCLAFSLSFTNFQYSGAGLLIEPVLNTLATDLQSQFNNSIASQVNTSQFLTQMGNANAGSTRSFLSPGVITPDTRLAVSLSGSLALSLGSGTSLSSGINTPSNSLPAVGVGAKTGLTVGVSGKLLRLPIRLDPAKTMYNFSFAAMDLSSLVGHGVTMKATQISAGIAYQVYDPHPWTPLIRFNGFRISSGLSYANFDATYATQFNLSETDSTTGAVMAWKNTVDLGVSSTVFSFTNEVTTGLRLFWIWNVYTGLGLDFNVGSSSITGGSTGTVTATIPPSSATIFSADSTVSGDAPSESPSLAQLRYLLGTEVDLGRLALYIQGAVSTPSVYSLNFGAHVLF